MDILVGADPEVFVTDHTGAFRSAHDLVPGDKINPHRVKDGAVQVDGMALEFNIDPAHSRQQFITNVRSVYDQLERMVPGYNLVPVPTATFTSDYFRTSVPPRAKVLGCDPDFDPWEDSRPNKRPRGNQPMRTAAGHVHIGWGTGFDPQDDGHVASCAVVARQMDFFLGINTLLWDPDDTRRSMYGRAGAFRPKPYGVEYRVPSNAWLMSEHRMGFVYDAVRAGMDALERGEILENKYGDLARVIINNNQTDWPQHHQFDNVEVYKHAV